ncbi:MAG: DUF1579 family protein [Planctomycetes bacterium]|nr:DUF1579 family protein [Planctomycetota bacterium]
MSSTAHHRFRPLPGHWRGIARTWFEPGVLADESPVEGQARLRQGGRFLEWEYHGALQGRPLEGFLVAGYFGLRARWEVAWTDTFHMGDGLLFSTGASTADGFDVLGHYPDGRGGPDWGWRTVLAVQSADRFVLTAYNVMPDGSESQATQALLERRR